MALEVARAVLLGNSSQSKPLIASGGELSLHATPREKISTFRSLFRGRTDVYAVRWENRISGKSGYAPACSNEWVRGVCEKPRIKCGDCPAKAFVRLSDSVIDGHLRGDFVAGVYPLLSDNSCYFVVVDFDGDGWADDSKAFVDVCDLHGVPVARERSRSGAGAHAWIFFKDAVQASCARQLATGLLSEAMDRRPEISFRSYDRLFPSQDTVPKGGFGNLIAMPLQMAARERGHSVFIDDFLRPFPDQWALLSKLPRVGLAELNALVRDLTFKHSSSTRLPLPTDDENSESPWAVVQLAKRLECQTKSVPKKVVVTLSNQIYIDRTGLPAPIVASLARVAAFQNPAFYQAQAMRFPTFDKPRVIDCTELGPRHIAVPRGCLEEVRGILTNQGVQVEFVDERNSGEALARRFVGTLRPNQVVAEKSLLSHDFGVLAATTAFGKTVLAIAMIAARGSNVLVLVHRQQLLDQWVEQLGTFLQGEDARVGTLCGGKNRLTGLVDVALIQSLVRRHTVNDCVPNYGHIIVDECHHVSAVSFEAVIKRARAKYVLGLSATVARKDGHHPIIFMQCGAVRHRVTARAQLAGRTSIVHRAEQRETGFDGQSVVGVSLSIAGVYRALTESELRNSLIFDDVLRALEAGRHPLALTERRDHLERLRARFGSFVRKVIVFRGGMSKRERDASMALLRSGDTEQRLVLATGRYLGEGFDCARLDTLFLTLPISWKGTFAQYVGRLHREHVDKSNVLVVDYVDGSVPMLARMAKKRQAGYRNLGYAIETISPKTADNYTRR